MMWFPAIIEPLHREVDVDVDADADADALPRIKGICATARK